MNESARASQFVKSKLDASGTLASLVSTRIYAHPGPPGSTWPMVTFNTLAAPDVGANGGIRVLTRCLILVRAIAKGGSVPANIADAIDDALHGQQGAIGGDAYVPYCERESAFEMIEELEGEVYRHLGGRYRVDVYAT